MSSRELAVMVLMCSVWGFHFVVIKVAVAEIPPIFYAALRMTLVAIVMAPFLRWRKAQMGRIFIAGLCLGGVNYAFLFSGLSLTTASAGAVAIELYAPFATLLSVVFLGEKVGWRRAAGITLAFAGVAIIALYQPSTETSAAVASLGVGVLLVASGAMVEAFGAIAIKQTHGFKPFELLAWFAVIGVLFLWPATFIIESNQTTALLAADKVLLACAIAFSAFGASIFAHSAFYWLLQRLPVSQVSSSALLATIFAVIFGVVLLGDKLGPAFFIGGGMTLGGVAIILMRTHDKMSKKDPGVLEPPAPKLEINPTET